MNYDQILPNIFVGSFPASAEDIDQLKQEGVSAVLNVQSDDDCHYLDIDWPALEAHYLARGMEARRIRIQDFDDDDLQDKLPEAVKNLAELLDGGHTVYVHCSAGINRSPSVVICYLHWIGGLSLEEAAQQVQSNRSCAPVMGVIRLATSDWRQT